MRGFVNLLTGGREGIKLDGTRLSERVFRAQKPTLQVTMEPEVPWLSSDKTAVSLHHNS